jgi:hypothetical protein
MNAFVVSGLTKRRAELAGDLEKCHGPTKVSSHRYTALSTIAASAAATASGVPTCIHTPSSRSP